MTDITKLAQSLKAAAEKATPGNWRAFQYHDGRCGVGGGNHDEIMVCEHISKRRPHDAEFIALANPANILALVEALEKAQGMEAYWKTQCRGITDHCEELQARIAELESRTVKLPQRLQPGADGYDDWYVHSDDDGEYLKVDDVLAMLTAAGIKVEADSLDADVNDRNQPGMVVAVHIDVGDFVKFRGQVYEVKETDFDDHDVTLWFVCGEVLKCAAGCPIEVVSAPVEDE